MSEPSGPDAFTVDVFVGPDAQLSPAVRTALEELARALNEEAETGGFVFQPNLQVGGLAQSGVAGVGAGGAAGAGAGCGNRCVIMICSMRARFPGMAVG